MSPDGGEGADRDRAFLGAFHVGLARIPPGATVLYSGGLDSSLIAYCLGELGREPRLATMGLAGAPDLAAGAAGARRLGLPWRPIEVDVALPLRLVEEPGLGLSDSPEPERSVRLSLELALRLAGADDLAIGQGADELFGGYAHFRGLTAGAAEARRAIDLARLLEVDWPWTERRARLHGRRLHAPFLAPEVMVAARAIPWPPGGPGSPAKLALRQIAGAHGLPEELAGRPKRALQYGAAVRRALDPRPASVRVPDRAGDTPARDPL